MSVYYRHLIEQGKLLDIYPNANAAFSLRLLSSTYTGPLFSVRRSVDNALLDIYPNSQGTFDETALTDWVGYNLFTYSEQLQQATWSKTNTTVTTDTIVAPDGLTTGDIVLETTSNTTHSVSRNLQVVSGKNYSCSFWVKPNGRNIIILRTTTVMSTDGVATPSATFDLSTGIKTADNGFFRVPPTITSAPNGWYLISYGLIANSNTATGVMTIFINSTTSFVGDTTKGIAIWGSQISETPDLKPYQKTEATAGGEGRIQTLYSQAGDGRTATELTANQQLRFVDRGSVLKNSTNGKPEAILPGVGGGDGTRYIFTSNISCETPHFVVLIYARLSDSSFSLFGNNSVGGSPNIVRLSGSAGSRIIGYRVTGTGSDELIINNEDLGGAILTATRNGSSLDIWKNNISMGSKSTPLGTTTNSTNLFQFNSTGNTVRGNFQEAIFWNQNYTSLRANITQEINNYYGIY